MAQRESALESFHTKDGAPWCSGLQDLYIALEVQVNLYLRGHPYLLFSRGLPFGTNRLVDNGYCCVLSVCSWLWVKAEDYSLKKQYAVQCNGVWCVLLCPLNEVGHSLHCSPICCTKNTWLKIKWVALIISTCLDWESELCVLLLNYKNINKSLFLFHCIILLSFNVLSFPYLCKYWWVLR